MNREVAALQPTVVWSFFDEISQIPRGSKKEDAVRAYVVKIATELGLKPLVDSVGNVLVRKPATPGFERRMKILLQSHLDMVQQKNSTTNFDFTQQGIELFVDGDYVKAKGTTAGADNGLGVAATLAVLASNSDDTPHPRIEALFTVDEETGMSGAKGLEHGQLTADIMLNLDTEDDNELTIGCAGGVVVTGNGHYVTDKSTDGLHCKRLLVSGLTGGHSGMDIHLGRANANKILVRLLWRATEELGIRLASIVGGGLSNAIPREAWAEFAIEADRVPALEALIAKQSALICNEYRTTDPQLSICLSSIEGIQYLCTNEFQDALLRSIQMCPNGIDRMSPDIQGLVQTSNNLARVNVNDGVFEIQCLCRSSVESEKQDLAMTIRFALENVNATVSLDSDYPGWTPRPDSRIVGLMKEIYREMYGQQARVNACHAGLECGIIGSKYPQMEMISFGPTILGAHSPDERVKISSVQKFWDFLRETLKRIPHEASTEFSNTK